MLSASGRAVCAIGLAAMLAACAAPVRVTPAALAMLPSPVADIVIGRDLPILLSTGYTRTLPAGTRWRAVGSVPQGTVYRPLDTVFVIEGRNFHEAYLVVRGDELHGFYLPGERNFSPLSPVRLPLGQGAR